MRLRQFTLQVENLSLKEVPGRLASYLTYLAREQAERDERKDIVGADGGLADADGRGQGNGKGLIVPQHGGNPLRIHIMYDQRLENKCDEQPLPEE